MEWLWEIADIRVIRRMSNGSDQSKLCRNDRNETAVLMFTSAATGQMREYAALLDLVRRNLQLVAVWIAKINRVRDFMILEFEFDSALFQFRCAARKFSRFARKAR